jgi:hypothetical protein
LAKQRIDCYPIDNKHVGEEKRKSLYGFGGFECGYYPSCTPPSA